MNKELEQVKDESLAEFMIELLKGIDPTNSLSIIEKGAKYFEARHNKKIYEFNKNLFHGKASSYEKNKLKDGVLSEDDYFVLLSSAINDDEEKKTTIYVTLYRNILKDRMNDNKFKILKILKSLTYSSLELIQKIYIHSKFEIQSNSATKTIHSFLKEIDQKEEYIFEIESLKQFGLLKVPKENTHMEYIAIEQTNFCLEVAELFFNNEELIPEIINEKSWATKASLISDLENINDITYIENTIKTIGIQTISAIGFEADIRSLTAPIIIYIVSQKKIPIKTINTIKEISKYKTIVKVSLDENYIDQLENIGEKTIYLHAKNKESENNFLNIFDIPDLYKW